MTISFLATIPDSLFYSAYMACPGEDIVCLNFCANSRPDYEKSLVIDKIRIFGRLVGKRNSLFSIDSELEEELKWVMHNFVR